MCSDEVKVFEGVNGFVEVTSMAQLLDIQHWLSEEYSVQRRPYSRQLEVMERAKGRTHNYPFQLWIQFYSRSDAVKFKLVFGGKFADIPHVEGPDVNAE